jgi:acyl-CoA synthetase (NDP forming)
LELSGDIMRQKEMVKKILKKAGTRIALTELESKQILSAYNIPVTNEILVKEVDEAVRAAERLGYPVVLKIISPNILHKTDARCVKLNLASPSDVRESYEEILRNAKNYNPKAEIWGVLVQKMVSKGIEVIVGMKRDPTFGPAVLFGLGGIFAEVLQDTALRVVPFTRDDAYEMVDEVKGCRLLKGYRSQPPADIESLVDIILKVAQLAQDFKEILEMDLNPIFIHEKGKGSIVVDARIILGCARKREDG